MLQSAAIFLKENLYKKCGVDWLEASAAEGLDEEMAPVALF